jgi:hypothetical protein
MFGRQPNLPIDLAFGLITEKERKPHTQYIREIRERLIQAYKLASEASVKAQIKQKEGYDLRTRGAIIEPVDRVLVRIVAFDNKHKISDRWENGTYIVLKKPNLDIPVYTVQTENGQRRKRTLHRNLLLPVGYISQTQRNKNSSLSQNQEHDFRRNKENMHLGHQMKVVVVVVVKKIIH